MCPAAFWFSLELRLEIKKKELHLQQLLLLERLPQLLRPLTFLPTLSQRSDRVRNGRISRYCLRRFIYFTLKIASPFVAVPSALVSACACVSWLFFRAPPSFCVCECASVSTSVSMSELCVSSESYVSSLGRQAKKKSYPASIAFRRF